MDHEGYYERNAEWLRQLRAEKDSKKQNYINVATEMTKEQVKKILNWKSPGWGCRPWKALILKS